MAELDTYKRIEHYAKNPQDPMALLGFHALRRRAEAVQGWHAVVQGGASNAPLFGQLYLGTLGTSDSPKDRKGPTLTGDALIGMPTPERDSLYANLCASVGIEIDPDALVNKRKENKK